MRPAAVLCAALSLSTLFCAARSTNVIILLSDDQGFGDIGYNAGSQHQPGAGGKRWAPNPPRTPHLDALASASSTLVFDRHYSGSPVCSPTRSSLLSGRTPDRECVFNAEGCGQEPAWSCVNPQPFPGDGIFTIADAARAAGGSALHVGKFHLGDFFPKHNPSPSFSYKKWPVVNPGIVGFTEWFSTEASASSTMCNCGCEPDWPNQAPGCVIGGGSYVMGKSYECTNYWGPTDATTPRAECHNATTSTLSCVTNSTTKIPGDDSLWQVARFNAFLNTTRGAPFLATLQLHTNHIPHPALPEYYHAYNGTDGRPAGDYLGTLTQMDAAIGVLIESLKAAGVWEDTLLWFFADNGPHPGTAGDGAGGIPVKNTATNGLRQCKASIFEGGIHVPGLVSWPRVITTNAHTSQPVYAPDVLPTLLELWGVSHPHPEWATDGESILPLLKGGDAAWTRQHPLAWRLGTQVALLDPTGRYKYVRDPEKGQCPLDLANYSLSNGPFLFDLFADPTESFPIKDDAARLAAMDALSKQWEASITVSQTTESRCLPPTPTPMLLQRAGVGCLVAASSAEHAALDGDGACAKGTLSSWLVDATSAVVTLAASGMCFHADNKVTDACGAGNTVWLGSVCGKDIAMRYDAGTGTFVQPGCSGMCAGVGGAASGHALTLVSCDDSSATGWATVGGDVGHYARGFD